jgi:hypothetical protein
VVRHDVKTRQAQAQAWREVEERIRDEDICRWGEIP